MKPPYTYYGGKIHLAPMIAAAIPPHVAYLEPFAGSLAVLFAKPPARHEIVNDLDGAIVNFWRQLRDHPDDLERACALTPYARDEYEACANVDDLAVDDLERARRFWVRVNQSFAKRIGRTGWSVTTARTQSPPESVLCRLGRFRQVAERLAAVSIECCDGVELIERLAGAADTVVYADPTYVWATRCTSTSGRYNGSDRVRQRDYRYELDDDDHRRLAKVLHATPATVLLSGYHSTLYAELYADWHRIEFPVSVQTSNVRQHTRRRAVEVVWTNRPVEGRLALGGS